MNGPQLETPNRISIDFADNNELREILSRVNVGDSIVVKVTLQVMEKKPECIVGAIEKLQVPDTGYWKDTAEPKPKEPIAIAILNGSARRRRGSEAPALVGPSKGPPQMAENMMEPSMPAHA